MFALRIIAATIALCVMPIAAIAQDRHALVIGIDAYDNLPVLQKAVNDGRAISNSLERAGFTVDAGYDLDQRAFVQLLERFLNRLGPGDEALVFYAGHGVAIENRNFFVPSDASAIDESSELILASESIGQDFLLEQIASTGARMTVMIVDACRNNPFGRGLGRSMGRDVGVAITQPPDGFFIMYSAAEQQVALDRLSETDPNPNSIYTRTLLPLLEEPGLNIIDIAVGVRGEVRALAQSVRHQQFPSYRDSTLSSERFFIRPASEIPETFELVNPTEPLVSVTDPCAAARADFALLADTDSSVVLEAFANTHSACTYIVALATERFVALVPVDPVFETPPVVLVPPLASQEGTDEEARFVQNCVMYHPSSWVWHFPSLNDLDRAEVACNAALEALSSDTTTADYAHVFGLLGRLQGFRSNHDAAFEMTLFAAESGDALAANNLGILYELGRGVAIDGDLAAFWFRRAGEAGLGGAWLAYGALFDFGELVPRDDEQALIGYRAAFDQLLIEADAGSSRAAYALASMHEYGLGIEANYDLAVSWRRQGAQLQVLEEENIVFLD